MNTPQKSQTRAYLVLGFGVLAIGSSAILVKLADAPGPVTALYRTGIAMFALSLPFGREVKSKGRLPRRGILLAALAGIFFALDLAAWTTGVVLGGATNTTLLANTAPLWVGLGAMFVFKEKLKPAFWAGLLMALLGAAVILGLENLKDSSLGFGSLYGLLAAIFYGGFFLFAQPGRKLLSSLTFFWISSFSSTLVLWGLTFVLKQPLFGYPMRTYIIFLAMGLVIQVAGWLSINYAQGYLPAALVSPSLLGQPVITAILAGPLLGESMTAFQVLGGLAVIAGVYIVHRSRGAEMAG